MITSKINFSCILCGEKERFYVMPEKIKTISKDYINSVTKFNLQCKKCGKNYRLNIKIEAI